MLVGISCSVLTTVAYTVAWDLQERLPGATPYYKFPPSDELDAMLLLMPVGFVTYSLVYPGWLFWGGFIAAQLARSRYCYALCALGGITFGLSWPDVCIGLVD